jgi:hypothetical protein
VTSAEIAQSVAALRAFLIGEIDTAERLRGALDDDEHRAYIVLVSTAFGQAVDRRFGEQYMPEDIIEFVANARAKFPNTAELVGAGDAEKTIRTALGEDDLLDGLSARTRVMAQAAMLLALVQESGATPKAIDDLLAPATREAKEYLYRRASK